MTNSTAQATNQVTNCRRGTREDDEQGQDSRTQEYKGGRQMRIVLVCCLLVRCRLAAGMRGLAVRTADCCSNCQKLEHDDFGGRADAVMQ